MQFWRLLPVFILAVALLSASGGVKAWADEPFSLESLAELTAGKNLHSVEDVLAVLPESLRKNYLILPESQSLQNATPGNPRILLFSDDAKFIATFNGEGKGSQELEMIEFDSGAAKFNFARGNFETGSFAIRPAAKTECIECHRADLRPNWQPYPKWPGTIGQSHPTGSSFLARYESQYIEPNDQEADWLTTFLKTTVGEPRYASLPCASETTFRRQLDKNLAFNNLIQRLNFARVARLVGASPDYAHFKFAALASLACYGQDFKNFLSPDLAPADFDFSGAYLDGRLRTWSQEPFNWLFLTRGISVVNWDMAYRTGDDAIDPTANPFAISGGASSFALLAEALVKRDPELGAFATLSPDYQGVGPGNAQCDDLKAASRAALAARAAAPPLPTSASALRGMGTVLNVCARCHSDFASHSDVIRTLAKNPALIDKIVTRIRPGNDAAFRMPKNLPALSTSEAGDLTEYFRGVGAR
jgi:cytochrome c553